MSDGARTPIVAIAFLKGSGPGVLVYHNGNMSKAWCAGAKPGCWRYPAECSLRMREVNVTTRPKTYLWAGRSDQSVVVRPLHASKTIYCSLSLSTLFLRVPC